MFINNAKKCSILLLIILFVTTPFVFANSQGEEHESEGLELSVISGLLVFICLICTVVIAILMKKGKASIKTHHTLAFITVAVALFHGVYNFLTH
jgi:Na+/H+ antiporter NhaC